MFAHVRQAQLFLVHVLRGLAASCTHPFARSTFQRFSYAAFRLRKFSVAVWRVSSEGIGVFSCFVMCCRNPGNQWTGAQVGGAALAHAKTKNSGRMHILKSPLPVSKRFSRKNSGLVHILESSRGNFPQSSIENLKK